MQFHRMILKKVQLGRYIEMIDDAETPKHIVAAGVSTLELRCQHASLPHALESNAFVVMPGLIASRIAL